MKTAFINPPWWSIAQTGPNNTDQLRQGIRAGSRWPFTRPACYTPGKFQPGFYLPYPFFLGSAAAYVANALKTPGNVVFRDSIARGEGYDTFLEWMGLNRPENVVLETGAAAWDHDLALIKHLKALYPSLRVAVAGPTAATASKSDHGGAIDAFLLGEYEKTALRFTNGENGVLGFNLLTRGELNALPYPMQDEEVWDHYWDACPKGQKAPHLQLFASRGCYYKCCFCAWPATMTSDDPDGTNARSVRFYDPDWIAHYVRTFKADHPTLQSVYFDDDTFNLSDKHVVAVSKRMGEIGIPWSAMTRADTCTRETWQVMAENGCFGVKIGFESGVQRVIDQIVGKKLDLKAAVETAQWLRKTLKMTVHGTFTVGLPGETREESQQTLEFIQACYRNGALDTHQLSGTAMIENTPLAKIVAGEQLSVYPEAKADRSFVIDRDGVAKLEAMK